MNLRIILHHQRNVKGTAEGARNRNTNSKKKKEGARRDIPCRLPDILGHLKMCSTILIFNSMNFQFQTIQCRNLLHPLQTKFPRSFPENHLGTLF